MLTGIELNVDTHNTYITGIAFSLMWLSVGRSLFLNLIKPPGADFYFDEYELLEFKFHKPQYQKSINQIMDSNHDLFLNR